MENTFKVKKLQFCAVAILSIFLIISGCSNEPEETQLPTSKTAKQKTSGPALFIKIGVVLPFSGQFSGFGQEGKEGIELAVEEARAEYKNKAKIETKYEDSKGDPAEAIRGFRKLADIDKVCSVIGEVLSSNTLAMAPVADELKLPLVVPASTNADITKGGNYTVRVCFLDSEQGIVIAKYAYNDLQLKRVAVVLDRGNDYSVGLAEAFKSEFLKLGGEVVGESTVGANDLDMGAQLVQVKKWSPDAVFLPLEYPRAAQAMRQAEKLGLKLTFFGGDAWSSPELFKMGGPAANGAYITAHFAPDSTNPVVKTFVSKFEKKYGVKPSNMAALSYDAAGMIIQAAMAGNNADRVSIKNQLYKLKDYNGVTGNITIKDNGDAIKDIMILKTVDNQFKFVKTIAPSE